MAPYYTGLRVLLCFSNGSHQTNVSPRPDRVHKGLVHASACHMTSSGTRELELQPHSCSPSLSPPLSCSPSLSAAPTPSPSRAHSLLTLFVACTTSLLLPPPSLALHLSSQLALHLSREKQYPQAKNHHVTGVTQERTKP